MRYRYAVSAQTLCGVAAGWQGRLLGTLTVLSPHTPALGEPRGQLQELQELQLLTSCSSHFLSCIILCWSQEMHAQMSE